MTSSPTGGTPAKDSKATTWMVIAGVLALVAIGFAVWGFMKNSDLDDAEAKLAKQEVVSGVSNAVLQREVAEEKARFRQLRRQYVREQTQAADQQATIKKESGELANAQEQTKAAKSQDEKDQAALKEAQQEAVLAKECVRGAVIALDRFFAAQTSKAGASAAVDELESIKTDCAQANSN